MIIGVFLLLLIPFILVSGMFFPYITGKAFFFRVVVEIMFAIWIFGALFYKDLRPAKSSILNAFGGFMVVIFLANIFGINFHTSFWSNFERMEGYITYLHLFALFIVASSVFKNKKIWDYLFKTSLAFCLIMCVHALFQFIDARNAGTNVRVASFLGNPIYLAEYVLMHIFIALLYIREAGVYMKYYYGFTIVLNGVILIMTGTRGAVIGLFFGILTTLILGSIFIKEKGDKNYRKFAIIALSVIVVLSGIFWMFRKAEFIQENSILSRFANISLTEKTAVGRFTNWGIAWDGFLERPILGYGQGNYNVIFDAKFDPVLYDQEQWFDHVHNIFLDMLVAGGLFGFVAYILLFVFAIKMLWKDERFHFVEKTVFVGMFVAYIIQNFFAFDNIVSYIYFILILSFIHSSSKQEFDIKTLPNSNKNQSLSASALVIFAIILIYSVNYKAYAANVTTIDAIGWVSPDGRGGHIVRYEDGGLAKFKEVYEYKSFASGEITQQIMNGAQVAQRFEEIDPAVRSEYITFAKMVAEEYIKKDPNNSRYYYLYGGFLANTGHLAEAEENLRIAVSLSPTKQSTRDLLAQILLNNNKLDEALRFSEETYNLEPAFDGGWQTYVIALYSVGELDKYNQLIEEARTANRLDRLDRHYRQMIGIVKENPSWHFYLADVLLRMKRFEEVRALMIGGIERFPGHKGEFLNILESLPTPPPPLPGSAPVSSTSPATLKASGPTPVSR